MQMAASRVIQRMESHHPPSFAAMERRHDSQPCIRPKPVAARCELRFEDEILELCGSGDFPRGLCRLGDGRCCEFDGLLGHGSILLVLASSGSPSNRGAKILQTKADFFLLPALLKRRTAPSLPLVEIPAGSRHSHQPVSRSRSPRACSAAAQTLGACGYISQFPPTTSPGR